MQLANKKPAIPDKIYTPTELAKVMKIRPGKIYAFIEAGELAAEDWSERPGVGRPRWRIPAEAVIAFREKRRAKSASVSIPQRRRVAKPSRSFV